MNKLAVAIITLTCSTAATAQLKGDLSSNGGGNSGLRIDLTIVSSELGQLSGFGGGGGSILGEASVVAFPTETPFNGIIFDSWNADVEPVTRIVRLADNTCEIDVEVILAKFDSQLTESVQGTEEDFDQFGRFSIDDVTFQVDALVRIVSPQLNLDATLSLDGTIQDSLPGRIGSAVGDLFLGFTPPPDMTLQANADDLPDDITSVELSIHMCAGNTSYSGPQSPAIFGDSDLDDDVDLFDFAFVTHCDANMADLRCRLHDFDGDGTLTLLDFGGLQRAFMNPAP